MSLLLRHIRRFLFLAILWPRLLSAAADPVLQPIPNQATPADTVIQIPLKIDNVEVSETSLAQFSAQASNTNLLPATGITFLKSSTNFSLLLQPAPCLSGTNTVTVVFRFGDKSVSTAFILAVLEGQRLLFISVRDPIEGFRDTSITISPVLFSVSGCYSSDEVVTASASNTTLFPRTNIISRGSGTNWTVVLTPATGETGESIVSFMVHDSTGLASATSARVIVHPVNAPPRIAAIADQTFAPGESRAVAFSIDDPDNAPAEITVRAYSSNTNVLADADLTLSNQGVSYFLTLRTRTNVTGMTRITVQAWDPSRAQAEMSFWLASGTNADLSPILSIQIQQDSMIRFKVKGHPGATNTIQASSDLRHWRSGATVQLDSGGKGAWTNATTESPMFFRLAD